MDTAAQRSAPLARVHWRNRVTGQEGHGEPIPAEAARGWVEAMSREYPQMDHWAVPVESTAA